MDTVTTRQQATPEETVRKDIREIRNWVRFGGIVFTISLALSLILGIYAGVEVSHVWSSLNSTTTSSNCASVGGTDTSC